METKPDGTQVEVKPPAEQSAPETAPKPEETPAAVVTPKPAEAPAAPKEKAGDVMATKPKTDTVPLATFLETKAEAKEVPGLKSRIAELEALVANGGTQKEIASDLAAIGEKYGVDKGFMAELAGAVDAKVAAVKQAAEAEVAPLREERRAEDLDKVFRTHFDAALEAAPEFKEIANAEVIKTLSLDPKNADKTFLEIIEETYGNAVQGKRTIEPTTPRGGNEPETIDYARAAKDTTYYEEVMANPKLKAEYNKTLAKRLRF